MALNSDNPMERSQSENMALMITQLLKEVQEQGKRIQELQSQRQQPAADVSGGHSEDAGQSRRKRKAKPTAKVPDKCRDDTRKIYKALLQGENDFAGFNLSETMDSPGNQQAMRTLCMEVVKDNGGEEKCPYSPREVRDAAKRYFRSLKDDKVRGDKGRLEEHRRKMRKAGRLTQKVNRRTRALNKCNTDSWDERNLRRAAEILDKNYMSSESSGDEIQDPPRLIVRRLAWESKTLKRLKKDLDNVCPPKGTRRERTELPSDRPVPDGAPTWAIKSRRSNDLDSSLESASGSASNVTED
ncbi:hypothetical protein Bbelb_254680 [Branchiostoma belcheri]|nr:hypothetical protein Bbelb_254680 [Branchiostoma belcheri]